MEEKERGRERGEEEEERKCRKETENKERGTKWHSERKKVSVTKDDPQRTGSNGNRRKFIQYMLHITLYGGVYVHDEYETVHLDILVTYLLYIIPNSIRVNVLVINSTPN